MVCNDMIKRSVACVKNNLYNGGFYNTKVVLRDITSDEEGDIFGRGSKISVCDTVISCIVEANPNYITYDNKMLDFDGDVRMTCRVEDKIYISPKTEIWLYTDIADNLPMYENIIESTFTQGTQYRIKSQKPSLYGNDEIYTLEEVGKLQ